MSESFPHQDLADRMVREQLEPRGINDPRVLDAMRLVPRHEFVPHLTPEQAYSDQALPTAGGQTISQPYIVAAMTQAAQVEPGMEVLEIGCGSGYQARVLAQIGARVWSVERDPGLAVAAQQRIKAAGLDHQIKILIDDGTKGWPPAAPYDRVLVTAAGPDVPQPLRDQCRDGGRIVIPIGPRDQQQLCVYERHGDLWKRDDLMACRFVPLIGEHGWAEGNQ